MYSPETPLEQSYLSYYLGWLARALPREGWEYIATVGLGVIDFVYRIITLIISVVSCLDSVHRNGHSERQCTMGGV